MLLKEKLLKDAKMFCKKEGIGLARLSSVVVNNGVLFKRIAKGGDCSTGTYENFQRVFSDPSAWQEARAVDRTRRKVGIQ